ncbi:MAG: hypothetical protein PWQ51_1026 [Methanolobus sp.]|jgi:hypothetical protein|uniref:Uncharacterized protein n=1 Tax=Methanolobus tindarius DSM 2278 TaxID=1090322 RepID=W9DP68_METTI|nr:hypothetical protein MettiDRAFT_0268 [Methanolobus tindarius DSM 2278]MDI3486300.1 hypothetical protein [Methanolobus sp.]MDK2831341.1 hypothetical protein [Methanolobus sp.]MDK2938862.1 hypothetical protein [Methanolobus sp.]
MILIYIKDIVYLSEFKISFTIIEVLILKLRTKR